MEIPLGMTTENPIENARAGSPDHVPAVVDGQPAPDTAGLQEEIHGGPYYTLLYFTILYYTILCYAMLCYAMIYNDII